MISSIELRPLIVRHILRRLKKRKPTPINMDVLFLLLDDDADIIHIATALILADEESNDDEVVHHVEEEPPPAVWGGSCPGKAPNLERNRVSTFVVRASFESDEKIALRVGEGHFRNIQNRFLKTPYVSKDTTK
jgi:hypothetical protein